MKCTNNRKMSRLLCVFCIAAVFMNGCGFSKEDPIENAYSVYNSALNNYTEEKINADSYFASNLCVTDGTDIGTDQTDAQVAEGAGAFDLTTKEVLYSQNIFEKLYPASTTKILTAYIILRDCNLNDKVTVSENAVEQTSDSSVCGLKAGDVITVENLLYGLMLASGNDAAVTLAEFHSGSIESFAKEMNKTALSLGATGTNFVNPNGLPDEEHYTTIYDMYLFFKEAIKNEVFTTIISSKEYTATYKDEQQNEVSKTWTNTNRYLNEKAKVPDGFTVIGGKTGTTNAAGYCLVLYSKNSKGDDIVSIVFKADGRSDLYMLMNQILSGFAK